MLANMATCWHQILVKHFDCRISYKDCRWITTVPDNMPFKLNLDGLVIPRAPRSEGIKVLGAQVSFDDSATAALKRCFVNAWSAFNKHRRLLCSPCARPDRRIALLNRHVRPAVAYCVGSLNLTKQQLRSTHGLHFRMLRKMFGRLRPPEENLSTYLRTVAARI